MEVNALVATLKRIAEIKTKLAEDHVLANILRHVTEGWPQKSKLSPSTKALFPFRNESSVHDGLLLRDNRFVMTPSMRRDILEKVHQGHLRIVKCRSRARAIVWQPCLRLEVDSVEEMVKNAFFAQNTWSVGESLLCPFSRPSRPWETVGSDLFELNGKQCLVVVDYFSCWIGVPSLLSTTATTLINHIKSISPVLDC